MSHMRSESMRGDLGDLGESVVGISVHDWAVERREAYFVSCSGVRVAGGVGLEVGVGCMNGIFSGLFEPSVITLSLGGG